MPIALHPDPLIAIILPASVFPVEIVMAARFVKNTNNISKLDAQPWDENVKAVAKFPELIAKMNEDLNWTVSLGEAFLSQRKELMDVIQALRLKAQKAGTLETTAQQIVTVTNSIVETKVEQQVVVVTNTVVQIMPANPEVIYVPSYPATVYYPPPVYAYGYAYYGYGYYPYAPLMTFGAGMVLGAAIWNNWNHCDWHGGNVNYNRNTNINVDRDRNRVDPRSGDRAGNRAGDRGGQGWQPDQGRLQRSGAPSAKTRESRGWGSAGSPGSGFNSGAPRASQQPARGAGAGGPRASQQPARGGAGQNPALRQQPAGARNSAQQRPASSGVNRPAQQQQRSSSAFNGAGSGGGNARNYSNRGSSSRGGGGFSGGGGGRGGGGRRR